MESACLPPEPRIVIVGTTGSGKTTLARRLSEQTGIPHIELDALHWGPNWQEAPLDTFRERIAAALTESTWIVDGNYSKVRDIVWGGANTLIWLDYTFPLVFTRLIRRTFRRVVQREELWNGNRERWGNVLSRHSLLWWAIKTYPRNRRRYPELLARPEYSHLTVIRLGSPSATERWLQSVDCSCKTWSIYD